MFYFTFQEVSSMSEKKNKILVADDEKEIRDILKLLLSSEGYEVTLACDGQEVLDLTDDSFDMFILDVNMPKISGFSAGAKLREKYFVPMIFLTAYAGESDKAMGFAAGADDYLTKPFSNAELLMRVKAQLRRSQQYQAQMVQQSTSASSTALTLYDLTLDPDSQSVSKNGEVIILTHTEFKILELFLSHHKKIFSIDNIYQSVWEDNAVGDSTVMVHIKNLRKKLGDSTKNPKYIKTAWGKGYYVD